MPEPFEEIDDERVALFDRLAALTVDPDDNIAELEALCQDDRLRVPTSVRNAVRERHEPV
ncbi:MAG: hypothetical protein ABIM89_19135 [Mycobacteriales bacterium]